MFQLYRTNPLLIFEYSIFGERHSGTNFLEQCMKGRFDLSCTGFYGTKHFFGWSKPETITYKGRHTLFIGITRDPYDWIKSMHNLPHHIHPHRAWDFKTFITSEWTSVDNNLVELKQDRNFITKEKYKNIFELRKQKLLYLLEFMPKFAQNYLLITYESFRLNHNNYLDIISEKYNLPNKGVAPPAIEKFPYGIDPEIKAIIDDNIDWNVEKQFGYYRR